MYLLKSKFHRPNQNLSRNPTITKNSPVSVNEAGELSLLKLAPWLRVTVKNEMNANKTMPRPTRGNYQTNYFQIFTYNKEFRSGWFFKNVMNLCLLSELWRNSCIIHIIQAFLEPQTDLTKLPNERVCAVHVGDVEADVVNAVDVFHEFGVVKQDIVFSTAC